MTNTMLKQYQTSVFAKAKKAYNLSNVYFSPGTLY